MNMMRHVGFLVLLVSIAVLAVGCPEIVVIPDNALDSAIRAEIGKPFGLLTRGDLLEVRSIDGRSLGIKDLSGIEYCSNLEWLDLDTNSISNLKPLEQLGRPESPFDSPLGYLNLDNNQITDITPLAGLLNLYQLSLFNNQVADIGPLVTNAHAGGLGAGDSVILDLATLNEEALTVDIPTLVSLGVNVTLAEESGGDTGS